MQCSAPAGPAAGSASPPDLARRDRATFEALAGARRQRAGPVSLRFLTDGSDDPARVAYAIGRRFGTAVERNRARRRLRAAIALDEALLLPGGAYLVAVERSVMTIPFSTLCDHVTTLLQAVVSGRGSDRPRALHAPSVRAGPDPDAADPRLATAERAPPSPLPLPPLLLPVRARGARRPRRGAWQLAGDPARRAVVTRGTTEASTPSLPPSPSLPPTTRRTYVRHWPHPSVWRKKADR